MKASGNFSPAFSSWLKWESETDEATALLRKENARLARRISQLEATLQQVLAATEASLVVPSQVPQMQI